MPLPGRKFTFKPRSLSDTVDATNAPPGAMASLANLVPAPQMKNAFTPRPGAVEIVDITTYDADATAITCIFVLGTRIYGLYSTTQYGGHKDAPFCYDLVTPGFVTISGVTSSNIPTSQATTGDWTPPTAAMIGQRIVFTHVGFAGGSGPYFGWIDISGFSITSLTGDLTSTSKVIQSISGDGTSAPIIDGVQPGMTVSGTDIPNNTTIVSLTDGTFDENTTATTSSNVHLTAIPSTTGMLPGMYVTGTGIPAGAFIETIVSSSAFDLNVAATASASGVAINVSGGGTITMSAAATGSANLVALTIAGGTAAAPLWGSGNVNVNPLVAVPVAAANFNNRAWYAVGNAAAFSDPLNATNATNANQVLTLGDNTAVTSLAGLPLSNQVTGGVLQSLIAFKGSSILYQISGDAATSNLAQNAINGSVGTLAGNTITATPSGLAFVAPDGVRVLNLLAQTTEPIGAYGEGVSVPFLDAIAPTRMCANYSQNVLRVTVQNGDISSVPYQEYWFDWNLKIWTGPHTSANVLIESYTAALGAEAGYGYISVPVAEPTQLWQSGSYPVLNSSFTENGVPLTWRYLTSLMPDNEDASMNAVVEATVGMSMAGGEDVTIIVTDDQSNTLDQVVINGPAISATLWGEFDWGDAVWGAGGAGQFYQRQLPWTVPLVFKQAQIQLTGASAAGVVIGNLYMRVRELGYVLNQ